MALAGMKITVIGAGIGGLAAARALALRGADVTVFEQAGAIREVGAGLQISPNGMAVLEALGLGEALRARSVRAGAVSLRDYRGGEVLRLDPERLAPGGYFCVHRADLVDILATGARQAGAGIRLLQKVRSVRPGPAPEAEMTSGATARADLFVGADGLHSRLRAALAGAERPFFTGQAAWRAVVPEAGSGSDGTVRLYMGPHRHLVSYPLRGGAERNVVAVQERAAWTAESWSQEDDPLALRMAFADFGAEARALLERVERVHLWGLFRHRVAPRWFGPGIVLLGDAAHPTLPFLAQGANMALEDAWVLAHALAGHDALPAALAAYQARREGRVRRVVAAAGANAWKYHLAFPPLRWAAHGALRLGGRLAPARMERRFGWLYGHDVTRGG